jgi:N-acetylglucosaminyl-diphospho-decaprenol L-rhamnosyltransferase
MLKQIIKQSIIFFLSAKANPDFAIISPFIQEGKDNDLLESEKGGVFEVKNVKGFAMFLNLNQFKDIGFFDENFFIYFEEIDLCKRLIDNNKKIYLDTNIKITHAGGTSHEESINYEMEKSRNWHWMWSKFYFNKKHYGYLIALLKVSKNLISAKIKFFYYLITFNTFKRKIYQMRLLGLMSSMIGKNSYYRPKI